MIHRPMRSIARAAVLLAVLCAVILLVALTVHALGSSGTEAKAGPSTSVVSHTTAAPPSPAMKSRRFIRRAYQRATPARRVFHGRSPWLS